MIQFAIPNEGKLQREETIMVLKKDEQLAEIRRFRLPH
jgi:hypothetical protein